jgi:DNA-binding transcriptional ArsR family regulator
MKKKEKKDEQQKDVLEISDLEQVRVLADPLRLRIVEALGEQERTTKQIAALIGEKPTKLYHHVESLEKVGLIRLARTRQNRGTLEKYYVAVARMFRADPRLFSDREAAGEKAIGSVVSTFLRNTADELQRLVIGGESSGAAAEEGIVSYIEVVASAKDIDQLRSKLHALIDGVGSKREGRTKKPERRYRLTVAFYPLDRFGK